MEEYLRPAVESDSSDSDSDSSSSSDSDHDDLYGTDYESDANVGKRKRKHKEEEEEDEEEDIGDMPSEPILSRSRYNSTLLNFFGTKGAPSIMPNSPKVVMMDERIVTHDLSFLLIGFHFGNLFTGKISPIFAFDERTFQFILENRAELKSYWEDVKSVRLKQMILSYLFYEKLMKKSLIKKNYPEIVSTIPMEVESGKKKVGRRKQKEVTFDGFFNESYVTCSNPNFFLKHIILFCEKIFSDHTTELKPNAWQHCYVTLNDKNVRLVTFKQFHLSSEEFSILAPLKPPTSRKPKAKAKAKAKKKKTESNVVKKTKKGRPKKKKA